METIDRLKEKNAALQEKIIELEQKNAKLQEQANRDPLTGLYNQRYFEERGGEEWNRAKRHRHPLSVLKIDLDNFKRINDEKGHLTGDKILQDVAYLLRKACRKTDILFRVGGDEFEVLLPETTKEGAEKLAERIKILSEKKLIELSCGIASWEEELYLRELREKADAEMYKVKRARR